MRERGWGRVKALTDEEKAGIGAACERLVTETIKPRLLRKARPTQPSYPYDVQGRWRGGKYSFIAYYWPGSADPEHLFRRAA